MERALGPNPVRRNELEHLFLSALPEIEQAVRFVTRRRSLSGPEAEDFASEVKLALIENDYEVLACFQGRSSLKTYLITVIQRLFLDRQRKQWGKWRPSAAAQRLGPVALRLELLLYRDGLPLAEAVEALKTNAGVTESREVLAGWAQKIPVRSRRVAESIDDPDCPELPASDPVDPHSQLQTQETVTRCQAAIERTMGDLPPEDRVVLRLRFEDDLSVADIARTLRCDQKKLYRRVESMLASLRSVLEQEGLAWSEVRAMIDRGECHLRLPPEAPPEKPPSRPSPKQEMP
jgi:RNA polymerase sigma factor (sigma-70 family)